MKILLVADLLIRNHDGCNRTLFHILDRLVNYPSIELRIICGEYTELPIQCKVLKVPTFTIPFNNDYKAAIPFLMEKSIEQFTTNFNPDIIHLTSPSPLGFLVQKIAKRHHISTTSIYHTNFLSYFSYYFNYPQTLFSKAKEILKSKYKEFYKNIDINYSPTNLMKIHLMEMGVSKANIEVWGRGLDKSIFNDQNKIEDLNNKLFNNNQPILLFASRLVWEKNLKVLADLYHYTEEKAIEYNYLVIGDGSAKKELMELMPKAVFLNNISQKDLTVYYASSDVFVFPSVTETFGNVLLESMACGLPIVAADGGSNTELVRNYTDGLIVPANDIKSYEAAISIVLLNRKHFSENALQNPKLLSWSNLISQLVKNWSKLSYPIMEDEIECHPI